MKITKTVCDVTGKDDTTMPLRITNKTGHWDFDLSHFGALEILRRIAGYEWVDASSSTVLLEELRQASATMRRERGI